jgi:hypothetical protein
MLNEGPSALSDTEGLGYLPLNLHLNSLKYSLNNIEIIYAYVLQIIQRVLEVNMEYRKRVWTSQLLAGTTRKKWLNMSHRKVFCLLANLIYSSIP